MSSKASRLISVGVNTSQAKEIASRSVKTAITAAGTVLADAEPLLHQVNIVETAAANSGVRLFDLPIGEFQEVTNLDADTIDVYPPNASQQINAATAGDPTTVAQNKTVRFTRTTATKWRSVAFD